MKNLYLIFFILILILCTGFSNSTIDISVSYQPSIEVLEQIFKTYMPIKQGVIYTKVPRGLIISVDENKFFSNGDARIKESSLYILSTIFNCLAISNIDLAVGFNSFILSISFILPNLNKIFYNYLALFSFSSFLIVLINSSIKA